VTRFSDYEDEDIEYSLSVSRFAKLCGTTRDTLRYYYEQEILTPRVDPNNGYHYYSASQISSFFFINTMRKAGCSIKDIRTTIHNSSKESISKLVNSKILDMQRELFLINKEISSLHLALWILEKYDMCKPGVPFLDIIPDMSFSSTKVKDKSSSYHAADVAKEISAHLARANSDSSFASFPSGVTIGYKDLIAGNYVYNNIFTLSFLPADNIDTFPLPSRKIIGCYHDHNAEGIDKTYKKMVSYIKRNKLTACSDLFSVSLINIYNKEADHTYFKYLFICVE